MTGQAAPAGPHAIGSGLVRSTGAAGKPVGKQAADILIDDTADRERFRAAMEISGDAIVLVDRAEMRYIDVNQTLCDLVGYTKQEVLAMTPMDLFSAQRAVLERDYDALIADNSSPAGRVKGEYRRKDGALVPVESRRQALRTDAGWIIVCNARDDSERKAAEKRLSDLARLRESEAAWHTSILNSLPAHIALLDAGGAIVSVNAAWLQATDANALQGPHLGAGTDYLAVCDAAARSGVAQGGEIAGGIRSVLSGAAPRYELEYSCASTRALRWFLLTVTPLAEGRIEGAVVMHVSTTEQRLLKLELRESERRFSDMLDTVRLISLMLDRDGCITYCNDYLLRLTGWRREEVIGRDWFDLFIPGSGAEARDLFEAQLAELPASVHHENEILERSGGRRLIKWNNTVLRNAAGDVIGTASVGDDITERKDAEARITYLNRVYAVLSGINTLIVRVADRDELFREATRIAVEAGGFRMAWIGTVDRAAMRIVPIASAGEDQALLGTLQTHFLHGGGDSLGSSLTARAVDERRVVVSNDAQNDPKILFGSKHAEAGIRSMAILPLVVSGEAVGVLALYAGEREFFHAEELKLLTELAGDIAFAIDHIGKQEKLDYLVYYDVLTGLANRSLFLERVGQYMRSAEGSKERVAVFLIDLERFKNINDSLGQSAGDLLLQQVAEWLTFNTGEANLLARISADRFALVLPDVKEDGDLISNLVEKTMVAFAEHPFQLNDAVFRIAAKVGIAMYPGDAADADTLLKNAEAALKNAKADGERYLFYKQKMTTAVAARLSLENQLRRALDNEEFVLHFQPKVSLATLQLTGAEALIRWNDPLAGLVAPGSFIPVLEETGLIYEVGRWALRKAVETYLSWRAAGLPAVRIAVNVSPLQLRNRGFSAEIGRITGVDSRAAAGLELEITESLLMADVKHSIATLHSIRALAVSVAIDDFGTGFSSLSYLSKLPVDTLKIDRSFVTDMSVGPDGVSLVSTVIDLARALKLKVVAEGVETKEQATLLRLLRCDEMQGFHVSEAVPVEEFEAKFLAPPALAI